MMQKTTYDGTNYLISDTNSVYSVTTGKRKWNRVIDMQLAQAIREAHENKIAREIAAYHVEDYQHDGRQAAWADDLHAAEMARFDDEDLERQSLSH